MDQIIFGDYTLKDLLVVAGAIVALVVLVVLIRAILKKDKTSEHHQSVACQCGWRGKVSKFAGRCPKCNQPLGERKATPFRK
jgi:hypothetical protein